MPKYIVSEDQPFAGTEQFTHLLSTLKEQVALEGDNSVAIHNAAFDYFRQLELKKIGKIIPEQQALDMLAAFGQARNFQIPVAILLQFFEAVNNLKIDPMYANTHEVGFRFYLGKETIGGDFNFVIVPCLALKDIVDSDSHFEDKEESWLSYDTNSFVALISKGQVSGIESDAEKIVSVYDYKKEKRVVYYPKKTFSDFIFGLGANQGSFVNLGVYFARTVGIAPTQLTLILRCLDKGNSAIVSSINNLVAATGTTFDEGDLIPPPPPRKSGVVAGDHPWIPDSIFDSI